MIARRPLFTGFGLIVVVGLVAASPVRAAGPQRITAATNLTLRQTPSADAAVLAFLPIGTEVTDATVADLDKTWIHVRLADNREGWLLGNLTRVVEPGRRTSTIEAIILDRLGRRGDGPSATIEVADFIERELPGVTDAQAAARFDLYRLRAVATVLATIRLNLGKHDPYLSWLDRHKDLIAYDEPGGRWLLSNAAVWQIHDQHADTAAADEIAWLAAKTGLPGECTGSLVCYVEALNKLDGEYLRRHPTGRHVDEAAAKIKEVADQLAAAPRAQSLYVFDRTRDCAALTHAADGLGAAVSGAAVAKSGKADATQSLAALRSTCPVKPPAGRR